jgi:hypothetical protein
VEGCALKGRLKWRYFYISIHEGKKAAKKGIVTFMNAGYFYSWERKREREREREREMGKRSSSIEKPTIQHIFES